MARLVGAKVTLAARVDSFHESTDGTLGGEYREDILKKLDKLQDKLEDMINQLGLLLLLLQRANLTPVVDLTHFAFCTEGFLFILKTNVMRHDWTVSFSYFRRGGLNPLAAPSNEGLFHYPFWPWGK